MEKIKTFTLPKLPYDYNALAPFISEQQLKLHHDKHHQAYVNGANAIFEKLDKARSENADADMKVFTKYYTDAYFFTEKETFNLLHYPDNEAWKLGKAPKNKTDFFELPVLKVAAAEFGLKKFSPNEGKVKTKVNKAFKFSFTLKNTGDIVKVELGVGEKKKYKVIEVSFNSSAGQLVFSYKFEEENAYPVTVFINGKELATYLFEVE